MYGERLKQARKEKGYTLIKVAMELCTTHATISRYENEVLQPSLNTLIKLCEMYNVSADYILGLPCDLKNPDRYKK